MFAVIPVYAAVNPQLTDGIRQIMVKSGNEIDVMMGQVSVIEGAIPTPLDPSSQEVITINQPGSYILTGSKVGGTIESTTPNVYLDFNGWSVTGTAHDIPIILIADDFVTVKNGFVQHSGTPVTGNEFAMRISSRGVELKDLSISTPNYLTAIEFLVTNDCLVSDCIITGGGDNALSGSAIRIGNNSIEGSHNNGIIVERCQINGFQFGISVDRWERNVVRDCFIANNNGRGCSIDGSIALISNNIIVDCATGISNSLLPDNLIINNIIMGCNNTISGNSPSSYGNLSVANTDSYDSSVSLQISDLTTGTSIGEYANISLS